MNRIDKIELDSALPRVFRGDETSQAIANSQIWKKKLAFTRPSYYLVSAESGTGKSSMCAFIYGDRTDYDGRIMIGDRPASSLSSDDWCELRQRHLAYLPQDMRLFPELTVMENLRLKNSITDRYTEAELRQMLEMLEIERKADSPAGKLSIGQQQRVAIIRAIAQPFDFILLDEPVSHLDSRNNKAAATLIANAAAASEASIIATSVGNHLLLNYNEIINL